MKHIQTAASFLFMVSSFFHFFVRKFALFERDHQALLRHLAAEGIDGHQPQHVGLGGKPFIMPKNAQTLLVLPPHQLVRSPAALVGVFPPNHAGAGHRLRQRAYTRCRVSPLARAAPPPWPGTQTPGVAEGLAGTWTGWASPSGHSRAQSRGYLPVHQLHQRPAGADAVYEIMPSGRNRRISSSALAPTAAPPPGTSAAERPAASAEEDGELFHVQPALSDVTSIITARGRFCCIAPVINFCRFFLTKCYVRGRTKLSAAQQQLDTRASG